MNAPTTDQLREEFIRCSQGLVYDGIPIIELGDDAEQVITFGHVDKSALVKAYDAYLRDVCGEPLSKLQGFTVEEFADEAEYQKARIRHLEEFPLGEFEVVFDENGDVDITVRVNY